MSRLVSGSPELGKGQSTGEEMFMTGERFFPQLEAAGLERGYRIIERAKTPPRAVTDLFLLRELRNIMAVFGPREGEAWTVLSLLIRFEDNVSAVGRELKPEQPESGRRQVTRVRGKLLRLAMQIFGRAAKMNRKSMPEFDLLRDLVRDHKAKKPLDRSVIVGPGFAALRKALLEIGRELADDPSLEAFGWRLVKAAGALDCPTPKTQ